MPPESENPGSEAATPEVVASAGLGTGDSELPVVDAGPGSGRSGGPWAIAWRRLRRNSVALFSLCVFLLIVLCCILAPLWANHVAHTGPNTTHTLEKLHEGTEDEGSRRTEW